MRILAIVAILMLAGCATEKQLVIERKEAFVSTSSCEAIYISVK
jgi:uncharacterized lipoprotein YajG